MAWLADWPLVGGEDFQALRLLDDLYTAATERNHVTSNALDASVSGEYDDAGDDLQDPPGSILPVTGGVDQNSTYNGIQAYCTTYYEFFVDHDLDYDQTGKPDLPWTLADRWTYTVGDYCTKTGLTAVGFFPAFTRTYPRRIGFVGAAVDQDGEAAALGQKALCDTDGAIYEYDGVAWIRLGGMGMFRADRKTEVGTGPEFGYAKKGDYINESPLFLNQMYEALDALRWQVLINVQHAATFFAAPPAGNMAGGIYDSANNCPVGLTWDDYEYNSALGLSYETTPEDWTDAKATAAADYAGGGSVTGWDQGGLHYFFTAGFTANATPVREWKALIEAGRIKYKAVDDYAAGTLEFAYTAEEYTNVTDVIYSWGDGGSNIDGTVTFDDNGTGYVQGDWKKIETLGPSTADKTFAWLGNDPPAVTPTWCVEAPPNNTPQGTSRGYRQGNGNGRTTGLGGDAFIIKWDVAGGFDKA